MTRLKTTIWAAMVAFAWGGVCCGATIEMVTVGDPGNAADTEVMYDGSTGYGRVDYVYRIGKYEVTNGQYREFLNAKAALGDPYALYNWGDMPGTEMDRVFSGITQTGSGTPEDPFVYTPKDDDPAWDTKPVNFVSWFDCLRFVNWLQNGQGDGDTESGTYTILNGGPNAGEVLLPTPAERASWTTPHYVLPTEDEWYKAAYYKGGSLDAGYWDYATQSDEPPDNNVPEQDTGNSANYFDYDPDDYGYAIGAPYYCTDGGAYALSEGPYGTFDQNGNLSEFLERFDGVAVRLRGGHLGGGTQYMPPTIYTPLGPAIESSASGFRVGNVPEPGTLSLLALGLTWLTLRCWLRQR